jgi:hypothetical protein
MFRAFLLSLLESYALPRGGWRRRGSPHGWWWVAVGVAPLCLIGIGAGVSADDSQLKSQVKGEVLVILAKEDAGEFDPKLARMPALRKPPFSSFKSMKVLSTDELHLSSTQASTAQLPNGRTLRVKLVERRPDGRLKIELSINQPGKRDYLPLLTVIASKEPFFVAGQRFQGGTLVIGVRVNSR